MANWKRLELRLNLDDPGDNAIWEALQAVTPGRLNQRLRELLSAAIQGTVIIAPRAVPDRPTLHVLTPADNPKPPVDEEAAREEAALKFLAKFG